MKHCLSPGDRVGRWTLRSKFQLGKHPLWECLCDCGAVFNVYQTHLRSGSSMGCKPCATVTHGMAHSGTWKSWAAMRSRCDNPKHPKYSRYGGRGISYPKDWSLFENFFRDMGTRPDGMTLERGDSNGDYSKENCKWASIFEQNNNRSNNVFVEYCGNKYTIPNLARHLGISCAALRGRIKNGKQIDAPYKPRKSPKK